MRYFDFDGNQIPQEAARERNVPLIGESLQHDLLLGVNNASELRSLVKVFKRYCSKEKMDKWGRKIIKAYSPVSNEKYAVVGAQDIPLLICTSTTNRKPKNLCDFLAVNQFSMKEQLGRDTQVVVRTLAKRRSTELRESLEGMGFEIRVEKKYVLRLFVEDYIDL